MFAMIWQHKGDLQALLLLALIVIAMWQGAGPERWIAGTFLGMFVLDRIYHLVFSRGLFYRDADLGHIMIDVLAVAAFGLVALNANRMYPLWLAGVQLMSLVAHVVRAINPAIEQGAYAILEFAPSYGLIAIFAGGVLLHINRRAKFRPYRSWLIS